MKNIYDMTLEQLQTYLTEKAFKAYNARQVFEWVYKKQTTDFLAMSNLSKPLRTHMAKHFTASLPERFFKQVAKDHTKKYLFKLHDGHLIETVLMHHDYGNSLCITTQVGCNIGCAFCASGILKKIRNLSVAEMVQQVIAVQQEETIRISHVVIMGTGEPFDNYDNLIDFIDIINTPYGLEIGARHITVSTAGIVPKIDSFAQSNKQVNLAISLHAPSNAVRSKLMKINDVYPIESLIDSVKRYIDTTNRRVTFEYILLDGVNDAIAHADALSDLLRGLNCYVNLIRYNPIEEFDFEATDEMKAQAFHKRLLKRGIQATLRREMGAEIDAACGQLRTKSLRENLKDEVLHGNNQED